MAKSARTSVKVPDSPNSIQKGVPLKELLNSSAVSTLSRNIASVFPKFDQVGFRRVANAGLKNLELKGRAIHIARAMHRYLPERFDEAIEVIVDSFTPPMKEVELLGLSGFFYLPHSCYIELFGVENIKVRGKDSFESSMRGMYELTKRFTAEFAIRPFLIRDHERVLKRLHVWRKDPNPHVRRLCSEGIRPRLPWGLRIPHFVANPTPILPFLDALKDDEELYVRRSVANNLGDIAKDHRSLAIDLCEEWLRGAGEERRWVIRHALRYPHKKGDIRAIQLRIKAGLRGKK